MSDPDKLDSQVDVDEGFEPAPYLDTEKLWTFGKGRCLETHPLSGQEWKRLLDERWISVILNPAGANWMRDMELAEVEAHLAATFTWWNHMNDARQNALIEMAYQMGVERFLGFKLMLKAISAAQWDEVLRQALASEWARETPARAKLVATQLSTGLFA